MGVGGGIDARLQGREDAGNDEQKNKGMWREKRKQFKTLKDRNRRKLVWKSENSIFGGIPEHFSQGCQETYLNTT